MESFCTAKARRTPLLLSALGRGHGEPSLPNSLKPAESRSLSSRLLSCGLSSSRDSTIDSAAVDVENSFSEGRVADALPVFNVFSLNKSCLDVSLLVTWDLLSALELDSSGTRGVRGVPGLFGPLSKILRALKLELELEAVDAVPDFGRWGVIIGTVFLRERRRTISELSLISLLSLGALSALGMVIVLWMLGLK
jgi:hypothetical protein